MTYSYQDGDLYYFMDNETFTDPSMRASWATPSNS